MNKPIIIEELGKIWGRDAIFLDGIEFDEAYSVKLITKVVAFKSATTLLLNVT